MGRIPTKRLHLPGHVVAALLSMPAGTALADMGTAPVGPEGFYGSIEGGYLFQSGDGTIGHGLSTTAGVVQDVIVDPGSGWFAGGMVGFANRDAYISGLPFHRVEFYGFHGETNDSAQHAAPPAVDITIKNVDGTVFVGGPAAGLVIGSTSSERQTSEVGLRFEGDDQLNATTSITWALSPFIRWSDERTDTVVRQCCDLTRFADVDSILYGVMLAAEPEIAVSPGIALVGRLGVGVYGYTADGTFRSSDNLNGFFAAHLTDGDSGAGFRGSLGAGLKFALTPNTRLETFAEADYFSHIATAVLSNNNSVDATASRTGTTDLWELRAGARLTIGFTSSQ